MLGGGLAGQNVTFYKVVFKIHFKPFCVILEKKKYVKHGGVPPYLAIFHQF